MLRITSQKISEHMSEVMRGASVSLVLKSIGAALAFGFNVLLVRLIGTGDTGLYFLALMIANIATIFGRVGLDNALLRFTSAHASTSQWAEVRGVYHIGMKIALVASSIVTICVFLIAPYLTGAIFKKPELTEPLRWMSAAIIPIVVFNLHGQLLRGLKHIAKSQVILVVGVPLLSTVGIYFLTPIAGLKGAIFAFVIATGLTAILSIVWWRSVTPQLKQYTPNFSARRLFQSSKPLFLVASINQILGWMGIFFLGIWASTEDVGIFSIATKVAISIALILKSVNSITAAKYAELYHSGQHSDLASTFRRSSLLIGGCALPIYMCFIFFPDIIMNIFSPDFVRGKTALVILATGEFINSITGSAGNLLMMTGHEKLVRNCAVFSLLLLSALCMVLIPAFDIIGAATAVAFTTASKNLIYLYFVNRTLGIRIFMRQARDT